ncbi:MAG: hypothetical protein ACLUYS_05575 [Allobaculum sp.]|uniref:hypothetical protein n=1 Tax=Allobaculum sp. TaxID=1872463 RepID=UPI00399B5335
MEFSEFAQILKPILGGDMATDIFTQELFDNMLNIEDRGILSDLTLDSFKNYFNGRGGISGIAKKISSKIELEYFATYIDKVEDAQKENLLKAFQPFIPELNEDNLPRKLAELFNDIIQTAARSKRKGAQRSANKDEKETVYAEIVDAPESSDYSEKSMNSVTYIQSQYNISNNGAGSTNLVNTGNLVINIGDKKK